MHVSLSNSIIKPAGNLTETFISKVGFKNIAVIAVGILSISIFSQKNVRSKIHAVLVDTKNRIQKKYRKQVSIYQHKREWNNTLKDGKKDIESVLKSMAAHYEPKQMLHELENCATHMQTTAKVSKTIRLSNPFSFYDHYRNNAANESFSKKKFVELADNTLLTKNPLYTKMTENEKQTQKVSYYSSFFTKMITFIPNGFVNLIEHVQDYPSQIIAILFSMMAPYTFQRILTEAKPLLGKIFGDFDLFLKNHSGKITLLFVVMTFGLFYMMKKINLPSVTDYAEEIKCGKVPHRGLDRDETFKPIIETIKLSLKKDKNQDNTSLFIKAPEGAHPPIKETVQMLAEMSVAGRGGLSENYTFKRVSINSLLVKANGNTANLKKIWDRTVQEYGQGENTFIHLDGLQTKLYPINEDEKKKSEVIALEGMIREDIKDGKLRVIISGDSALEQVFIKDSDLLSKFSTCEAPKITNVKEYIQEVFNPQDHSDSIYLTQDTLEFIASIPKTLHQQERLPSALDKPLNAILNKLETERNSLLLKHPEMQKKYKEMQENEGRKLDNLRELKEELLQKWWALKQAGYNKDSKEIQELAKKLALIKHTLIPLYAAQLKEKKAQINQGFEKEAKQNGLPAKKIPFKLEKQRAIELFERYTKTKLAPLSQDEFRVNHFFAEHMKQAVPEREDAINDLFTKTDAWIRSDQKETCGPAAIFVLAGPAGWGKTELAKTYAMELHHLLNAYQEGKEERGITPEQTPDQGFAKDIQHLQTNTPPPNFRSYDLTHNPWDSGTNSIKVINDILKDVSEGMKVISLDELDKIPIKEVPKLLGPFDERFLEHIPIARGSKKDDKIEDTQAKKVASRAQSIFFITMNLCEDELSDPSVISQSYHEKQKMVKEAFTKKFGTPFKSRIDAFIPIDSFQKDAYRVYIANRLQKIKESYLNKYHIKVTDSDEVVDLFLKKAYEKEGTVLSLREMNKLIDENFATPIHRETYLYRGKEDQNQYVIEPVINSHREQRGTLIGCKRNIMDKKTKELIEQLVRQDGQGLA